MPSLGASPDERPLTRLLLIRHAQAALPSDLRLPGPDLPLTPPGEADARRLANRLRDVEPMAISSSDALRARQTADIIASVCQIPVRLTPALREIDLGAWSGRTYADIVAADPAASEWFSYPDVGTPPGGERAPDAANRILHLLRTIARDETGPVAIVGHTGSLRLAVAMALGMSLSSYWRLRLDCASISVVTWSADGLVLERWNDITHLGDDRGILGAPDSDEGSNCDRVIDAMCHREDLRP